MQACQQLGFTPKEGGRSGQADFLAALVAAGQGVVLLPSVVARGLVRPGVVRLTLRAGLPALGYRVHLASGAYLSKAAQAWLALLRERAISPQCSDQLASQGSASVSG
jgi:DNA-binding transcriptional LysR family regulator